MISSSIFTNVFKDSNHRNRVEKLLLNCNNRLLLVAPFISSFGANIIIEALNRRAFKADKLVVNIIICDDNSSYLRGSLDPSALMRFIDELDADIHGFGSALHAKLYIFDDKYALITSSNLTKGGLEGNYEIGILIEDQSIIRRLILEFTRLWEDSQEISSADLSERIQWIANNEKPTSDPEPPFSKKRGWKPIPKTGSGDAYGSALFSGFDERYFEHIDPAFYGGSFNDKPVDSMIVKKIQRGIEDNIKPILRRFYLAVKDYLPPRSHLNPHYATRTMVKNFYPSAAWLGLGRDVKKYVTLAQLTVGLSIDKEGKNIFVSFNLGEEYQLNEDKVYFLRWISRNMNEFIIELAKLDINFYLKYWIARKECIMKRAKDVDQSDINNILRIPHDRLINMAVERKYNFEREKNILTSGGIVREVADQFETLYNLYRKAFRQ